MQMISHLPECLRSGDPDTTCCKFLWQGHPEHRMPEWAAKNVVSSCTVGADCTQSYIHVRTASGDVRCNYGSILLNTKAGVVVKDPVINTRKAILKKEKEIKEVEEKIASLMNDRIDLQEALADLITEDARSLP